MRRGGRCEKGVASVVIVVSAVRVKRGRQILRWRIRPQVSGTGEARSKQQVGQGEERKVKGGEKKSHWESHTTAAVRPLVTRKGFYFF